MAIGIRQRVFALLFERISESGSSPHISGYDVAKAATH